MTEHAPTALAATLELLGETLPKATRSKIDAALARARLAQEWRPRVGPDDVVAAAASAISAGRDPAADPLVRDAYFAQYLAAHTRGIGMLAGRQLASAVAQHIPAVVSALCTMYQRLVAEPVTTAAAALAEQGVTPDTPADGILPAGVSAGDLWLEIRTATLVHDELLQRYTLLRGAFGLGIQAGVFLWCNPGPLGLVEMRNLQRAQPTPWKMVAGGCLLGLTDMAGATQRQAQAAAVDELESQQMMALQKRVSLI